YGSTRISGTGSGVLKPTAPCAVVASGSVCVPDVTLLLYAPPSCRLTATGSRLPPIRRSASEPPSDVTRVLKLSGCHDDAPTVTVVVPTPSDTRPAIALLLLPITLERVQSPAIITPDPPLGLFHTGTPPHRAAAAG